MMGNVGDGGNKLVFPDWLSNSFYVELTVETRLPKGWENKKKQRNESWDLLYYCLALMHSKHCRYHKINWESPPSWADVWDSNDFVFSEDNKTPFKPQENKDVNLESLADLLA
jgi:phage terminase large subunit GpA-like protein